MNLCSPYLTSAELQSNVPCYFEEHFMVSFRALTYVIWFRPSLFSAMKIKKKGEGEVRNKSFVALHTTTAIVCSH